MEARRLRFLAALVVFAAWVFALGWLAVRSGRKPPPRVGAEVSRRDRPPLVGRPIVDGLVVDTVAS